MLHIHTTQASWCSASAPLNFYSGDTHIEYLPDYRLSSSGVFVVVLIAFK